MNQLDNLYRDIILDHYRKPRNRGRLEVPPAWSAKGFNPLCGDEITVYVIVDRNNKITEITTEGYGCSISQASASLMTTAVKNRQRSEALNLTTAFKKMLAIEDPADSTGNTTNNSEEPEIALGDLKALQGVLKFPVRIKCATLCWNALLEALENAVTAYD
ncbi:MAG: SUF system NifU family Fe-S cluster assembly protein [Acidimicrobiaceae bacterium]|nr:SUF system NifU family Fe-S cluster assembly protein [Acidimicrobiaceae bacterium]